MERIMIPSSGGTVSGMRQGNKWNSSHEPFNNVDHNNVDHIPDNPKNLNTLSITVLDEDTTLIIPSPEPTRITVSNCSGIVSTPMGTNLSS
ncbi:hypothetical protein VNI00_019478 [Paramarasmius palmivorus]|uniref:Uncharacterized protein n=1 Tax=Paramarasmius palmivorus TaxID=297713 RepID=A0AAW0AMP8_9AGAR